MKARSLEDSCKEIGSYKHSTLIHLQRSTRTNSLDIKSATCKNNESLDPVLYCKGTKASRQELTSLHESLQLPFCRPLRTVWDIAQERLLLTNASYCQNSVFHFQTPIFENKLPFSTKKTPIFNSNSDVPLKFLYISTQLF